MAPLPIACTGCIAGIAIGLATNPIGLLACQSIALALVLMGTHSLTPSCRPSCTKAWAEGVKLYVTIDTQPSFGRAYALTVPPVASVSFLTTLPWSLSTSSEVSVRSGER